MGFAFRHRGGMRTETGYSTSFLGRRFVGENGKENQLNFDRSLTVPKSKNQNLESAAVSQVGCHGSIPDLCDFTMQIGQIVEDWGSHGISERRIHERKISRNEKRTDGNLVHEPFDLQLRVAAPISSTDSPRPCLLLPYQSARSNRPRICAHRGFCL